MSNGLFQAIRAYRIKQVKFLFDSGLSANVRNQHGQSTLVAALHIEDAAHRARMFRYLRHRGANCAAFDRSTGRSVFMWACFLDRTEQALFLLQDQGGYMDIHHKDTSGRTAMHYAATNGNSTILQAIIEYSHKYGLSVDVHDSDGFTPYLLARRMGHRTCAQILQSGGASHMQFDDRNHRSSEDWQWFGEREKSYYEHRKQNKTVGMYKLLGRLPEIKAANYKANEIKIVPSKVDKTFLSNKCLQSPAMNSERLFRQTSWMDYEKSRHKRLTRSLPNFQLSPIEEISSEGDTVSQKHSNRSTVEAALHALNTSSRASYYTSHAGSTIVSSHRYSPPPHPPSTHLAPLSSKSQSTHVSKSHGKFADIMHVFEDQCTHAYRPHAKKKLPVLITPNKTQTSTKHEKKRRVSSKLENHVLAKKMARKLAQAKDHH